MDHTTLNKLISGVCKRNPDEVIHNASGVYLNRWYLVRNPPHCNVYIHQFLGSDEDRALHDHPWQSVSVVLQGSYLEHLQDETVLRQTGDVIFRNALEPHRVELLGEECWTLFITGKKTKDWGFFCPEGWVHHEQFEERGCNE